jgi:hypothetical protein
MRTRRAIGEKDARRDRTPKSRNTNLDLPKRIVTNPRQANLNEIREDLSQFFEIRVSNVV